MKANYLRKKTWKILLYGMIGVAIYSLLGGFFAGNEMNINESENKSDEENSQIEYPRVIEECEDYNRIELSDGQVVAVFHHEQGEGSIQGGIESIQTRDAIVGHTGRLGSVSGNGTTIINNLYAQGMTAFCAERWSDPVSYAEHFNDGTADTSKMSWAIGVGLDNLFGDVSGHDTHTRKVVVQAAMWYFEGTLPWEASVTADGRGDVTYIYHSIIQRVESEYNKAQKLSFSKNKVITSFDENTQTIISEPFMVTEDSVSGRLSFTIPEPFFVTTKNDITPLTHLEKGQEIVVRTYDLSADLQVNLEVMSEVYVVEGNRFSHPTYPELQDMLTLPYKEKKKFSATLTVLAKPALGSYKIIKKVDESLVNKNGTLKIDVLEMERKLIVEVTGENIATQTPSFTYNAAKKQFETAVFKVKPGQYFIEEKAAPDVLLIEKGKRSFRVLPNKMVTEAMTTVTDKVKTGKLQVKKMIDQQAHDDYVFIPEEILFEQIQLRVKSLNPYYEYEEFIYFSSEGIVSVDKLPFGLYEIQEVSAPSDVVIDPTCYQVKIEDTGNSNPFELEIPIIREQMIFNRIKRGVVEIEKKITDTSIEGLPKEMWGLEKIQIEIIGIDTNITYKKVVSLSKEGTLTLKELPMGTYEIREIFVPDHMEKDDTVHRLVLTRDGQKEKFTYTNILPSSEIEIEKKNNNGDYVSQVQFRIGTKLLMDIDGKPVVYEEQNGIFNVVKDGRQPDAHNGLFHRIDPTSYILGIYTTEAPTGSVKITGIPYGYKFVYIEEIKVPDQGNYILNRQPKKVRLKKNECVKIEFVNKVKVPGIIEIIKRDEYGVFLSLHFDVYKKMNAELIYVETVTTSALNGVGRSSILDIKDEANQFIQYYIKEQETEYMVPIELVEIHPVTWNSQKSSYIVELTNSYKKVSASLWKMVEKNDAKVNAKGIIYEWYNKRNELMGTFLFGGDGESKLNSFIDIRELLDGKGTYVLEKKVGAGVEIDTKRLEISPLDLKKIKHNEIIALNTKETIIRNKPTETFFEKNDETTQKANVGNILTLYDDKRLIKRWESTQEAEVITGLQIGKKYQWCEELIVDGMKIPQNTCQTITITKNKEKFVMNNVPTEVVIHKYADEQKEENRQAGNLFQIRLKQIRHGDINSEPQIRREAVAAADELVEKVQNAVEGEVLVQFISLSDAPNIVKYLPIGFLYTLEEIESVDGYTVAQSQDFEVPPQGVVELVVINDRILVKTGTLDYEVLVVVGALFLLDGSLLILWQRGRQRKYK